MLNGEPTPNRVQASLLGIAEVRTDERSESRNKVYFDFTKQGGGNASRKEEKKNNVFIKFYQELL